MKVMATVVLVLAAIFGCAFLFLHRRADAFSARTEPTRVETLMARAARTAATPASARNRQNPITDTPQVFEESMAHYADHCAVCHGNDGSGDTMFGRGMYPRPPDLRRTTLTDGELFSVIENGVRLTGMPAFGSPGDDGPDSWKLVRFIRHLPKLTPEQLQRMQAMNPKSPDDLDEEKREADFLNGK